MTIRCFDLIPRIFASPPKWATFQHCTAFVNRNLTCETRETCADYAVTRTMENSTALIAWVQTFDFKQETIAFTDGIVFEKLLSQLEGNTMQKENWEGFTWDPTHFCKRVASSYFKLGCGSTLENVLELVTSYRVCIHCCLICRSHAIGIIWERWSVSIVPLARSAGLWWTEERIRPRHFCSSCWVPKRALYSHRGGIWLLNCSLLLTLRTILTSFPQRRNHSPLTRGTRDTLSTCAHN